MKNEKIYNIIALLLLILSGFLYFKGFLIKILYHDSYYLLCTDFGQYLLEVQDYLRENTYFSDLLKVGEEPGLFVVTSIFGRIANIPSQNILVLLSMFMYFFNGLFLYLLSRRLAWKNKYIGGIICLIVYISLYSSVYSYLSGIWRQMIGHLFFLAFLLSNSYPKTKGNIFIGAVFFSMCIISHRLYTIIGIGPMLLFIILSLLGDKKNIKTYIFILLLTILFTLPYLFYYSEYVHHYIKYAIALESAPPPTRGNFSVEAATNLGYSFFGPLNKDLAIAHFFFYQSWILVAGVAFCKTAIQKINRIYLLVLAVLLIYISFKFDFSIRILLLFQVVLIPIIGLNLSVHYRKITRLLIVIGIFLLGFLILSNTALKRTPAKIFDEGIYFLLNNINKNEEHFFMGSACSGDLLSQLGFTNHFSFHMGLKNVDQKKKNGELDYYDLVNIQAGNINLLKREGVLFDFYKDKKTYIIFIDKDAKEVNLIKSGRSQLLGKEYLTLVYPQYYSRPGTGIIKYVFLVNKDAIKYTDTREYIAENVKNFDLDR